MSTRWVYIDNGITSTPPPVFSLVYAIAAGENSTGVIGEQGSIWMWGGNSSGQLGQNNTTSVSTPVALLGSTKNFCKISTGFYHTLGIDNAGQVWGWGYNSNGQLGINSQDTKLTPMSILGNKKTFCTINAESQYTSHGIDKNGRLWSWGRNEYGQLGNNDTTDVCTPVSILGGNKTFCHIAGGLIHTVALDKNGRVWGFGYNGYGQLGNNSTTDVYTPVSILGGNKTFCHISSGFFSSHGIDKNGKVWGWGYNNNGQIGDNSVTSRRTPVALYGTRTFCQIAAGNYHTLAIDNHGKVFGWGYNFYGQLGNNAQVSKRTPVSILGAAKTFCQIAAGTHFSLGIDNHNQLWTWGYNNRGQLGNNTTNNTSTPILIT